MRFWAVAFTCWALALIVPAPAALAQSGSEVATLGAPTNILPQRLEPPSCPCEPELIGAEGFPVEQVGYIVFDLATGVIVASQNPDRAFIPASVQKLPTMVAALSLLGAEYTFKTQLLATAPIRNGVLAGDLYLKGGGDPFLTTDALLTLVLKLKDQGLTEITGGFYYDETALPHLTELNSAQPAAVPYNPGLSALNVNFNIVELNWWREPATGEIVGSALSRSDTLDVPAEAIVFSQQPQVVSKRMPVLLDRAALSKGEERWLLSPALPKKGELRLPVKLPGLNAAAVFRRIALDQGIVLPAPKAATVPQNALILAQHESVPLDQAAKLILRYSNNLAAELVALTAAQKVTRGIGSLAVASQALTGWLKQQIPQANWTGFVADTGSGLSTSARMTPRQVAAILTYAWSLRFAGLDVYSLMPRVKWNKELNELYEETAVEGSAPPGTLEVRAKSGTVYWSRGLAGYIQSSQGRMLGFALFVGDLEQRAAYDAALNIDELGGEPGARDWTKRAKALEQALVSRWATGY